MTDRPILFSAPMIRALLDGRKTQTRRVIKPQPIVHENGDWSWEGRNGGFVGSSGTHVNEGFPQSAVYWSRIQRGDRLWVREAWHVARSHDQTAPRDIPRDADIEHAATARGYAEIGLKGKLRPSMFMPRWASRLTLYVTDVRVQRLQDISGEDAIAEGAASRPNCSGFMGRDDGWSMDWSRVGEMSFYASRPPGSQEKAPLQESDLSLCDPQMAFASYWNDINGPDAWELNPWVAAYTFEARCGNIDSLPAVIGEAA